jgi:endonuclease/exonuclease/phosphatase (EEP) superfamily protein YafD
MLLLVELLLAAACTFTIVGQIPYPSTIFLLAAQFPLQYLIVQIPCLIVLALRKRWPIVAVGAAISLINLLPLAPLVLPLSAEKGKGETLRILQMNLDYSNLNHQAAIDIIRKTDPDLVLFEELTVPWQMALAPTLRDYPYCITAVRNDPLGIGAYSKRPINNQGAVYWHFNAPQLIFNTTLSGKPISFVHVHLELPSGNQTRELRDLAQLRQFMPKTVVIAGDFNTASWTSPFRKFLKNANLRDSQQGQGFDPTWPSNLNNTTILGYVGPLIGWLLKVPIDHYLISPDLVVLKRQVEQPFGSDHRPVFIELQRTN